MEFLTQSAYMLILPYEIFKLYFRDFACPLGNLVDINQNTQKTEVHCHISCISSTSKYLQLFRISPPSTAYILQFSRMRQHGLLAWLYQGKFDINETRPSRISTLIKKNRTDDIAKFFSAPKKSPFQNLAVIRRTNMRLKLVCSKSESAEHGPTCLATNSERLRCSELVMRPAQHEHSFEYDRTQP